MPKSLRKIEAAIHTLAQHTVERLVAAGPETDFVPLVAAPYPLHVVMQILGVPEEDEPRMLFLTQQMFGAQDEDLSKSGMAAMTPEQITEAIAIATNWPPVSSDGSPLPDVPPPVEYDEF